MERVYGRTLCYQRAFGDTPLLGRPVPGGPERTILPCVHIFGYAVAAGGIYYHECVGPAGDASPVRTLHFWDEATGKDRVVATVEADWIGGMSVSRSGSIAFGRGTATSDLMMIENFS